jgi:uncharacterized membrane protein YhaH (DUF805 family)
MNWVNLFTSFEGRISRQPFWIALVVFIAIDIATTLTIEDDRWNAALDLVLTYPQFAVCAKRGHDRNTPMWVVGLFFALGLVFDLLMLGGLVTNAVLRDPPVLLMALLVPYSIFALALLIDLGFRRGTVGPNRYGPDPFEAGA